MTTQTLGAYLRAAIKSGIKLTKEAFTGLFDFADHRDIDKHAVCVVTLYWTYKLTTWGMHFAEVHQGQGSDAAVLIAAVLAPFMALQGAVIRFYFSSRPTDPPIYGSQGQGQNNANG